VRIIADACRDIVAGPVGRYQQIGFGLYLVALKETAVPIGICGLLKRESMKDIAIGFAFLERFWAKGYAYESAAVMDYARTSLGLTHRGDDRTGEWATPSGCWRNWGCDSRGGFAFRDRNERRVCMHWRDKMRAEWRTSFALNALPILT
jgi:hypothetical protein